MKKTFYLIPVLALFLIIGSAFITVDKASVPDAIANDYLHSVFDAQLVDRFETQFYDIFSEVSHIDAHQSKSSGDYYYTVYGSDAANNKIVDYFKTTEQEVLTSTYDYIEMNSRTLGSKKCREAIVWPPPTGQFCHPNNPGWVCGVQVWPYGCFLY